MNHASPLHSLGTFVPNLEKLCLVIKISDNDKASLQHFERVITSILANLKKFKVLQIVAVIEDKIGTDASFCVKKIKVLTELIITKVLVNAFIWIRNNPITENKKQSLLFKFHVKSSHSTMNANCKTYHAKELRAFVDSIQSMIVNYLMTYPLGKIQFKLSWNILEHLWLASKLKLFLNGLDELFRLSVQEGGYLIEGDQDYHLNE
eukprot:UN12654